MYKTKFSFGKGIVPMPMPHGGFNFYLNNNFKFNLKFREVIIVILCHMSCFNLVRLTNITSVTDPWKILSWVDYRWIPTNPLLLNSRVPKQQNFGFFIFFRKRPQPSSSSFSNPNKAIFSSSFILHVFQNLGPQLFHTSTERVLPDLHNKGLPDILPQLFSI